MNYLEEKIMRDGVILPGNVLKVDSFLNHQVDIEAMRFMAQELQRRFEGVKITKILTTNTYHMHSLSQKTGGTRFMCLNHISLLPTMCLWWTTFWQRVRQRMP